MISVITSTSVMLGRLLTYWHCQCNCCITYAPFLCISFHNP